MKTTVLTVIAFCIVSIISGQNTSTALRIDQKIILDGHLDEEVWSKAAVASDFTNWQPAAGTVPSQKTEVKVLYDDEAMYIGAYLEDDKKNIMMELSDRDNIGNTDWFGFVLDTYGNATEAIELIVTCTGTQFDAKVTSDNGEDSNWDAVWFSEVSITDSGWYVEMKIPYNVIRFPNQETQEWRVNYMRRQAKTSEKNSFQYLDPEVNGFITQTAYLKGISNIKPPLRLSFSPYISAYALHSKDNNRDPINSTGYSYNGGMDVKYGINESFTLDMTLIPDFGQVQSDPQVLNLSPFEVQFSENRQFFTEGTEIFNKGNLFYSRRVGGNPIGQWKVYDEIKSNEIIDENPQETQLYNATKISGRTKKGLGIGVFNAVAAQTFAILKNTESGVERQIETSPLTNYNVLIFDQNLANNSSVSFANTNVWRNGDEYHDANVSAIQFDLKNKNQSYGLAGGVAYSQLILPNTKNVNGLRYNLSLNKISGNLNVYLSMDGTERDFNSNDLSYLTRTNIKNYNLSVNYGVYKEFLSFNRANFWTNLSLGTTYDLNAYRNVHLNFGFWTEAKNLWNYNMWFNAEPTTHDYFEPRTEGRFLKKPGYVDAGYWMGTDNRKKLRLSFSYFARKRFEEGRYYTELDFDVRYRVNNKFTFGMGVGFDNDRNDIGFVNKDEDNIYLGRRDRYVVPNEIFARYTFSDKMSLRFDLRHYWTKVYYDKFYTLALDGTLKNTDYTGFEDLSFNQFNIDMTYRWRFAPGSDIFFVWKQNISGFENEELIVHKDLKYNSSIRDLRELPQSNSLSVRLVYYLDYNQLKL